MKEPITKVVLRRWKQTGDVFALFPELAADLHGHCDSYEEIGGHGAADYFYCLEASKPIKNYRYDLAARAIISQLTRIGYNLKRIQRTSHKIHTQRLKSVREI